MNRSLFKGRVAEILLVEDNPGDVRLTEYAFEDGEVANRLHVVGDGEEAWAFLLRQGNFVDRPRPDLILLDLNLPKMDGRELLRKLKADEELKAIPVVIFTSSNAEEDIFKSYCLRANCYVTKPMSMEHFFSVMRSIQKYWFSIVSLP